MKIRIPKAKINIRKPAMSESFFYLGFGMYLIFGLLQTSFYYRYFDGIIYRMILYTCILTVMIREFVEKRFSQRQLWLGLGFVLLIVGSGSSDAIMQIVVILVFMFAARKMKFDDIAIFSCIITSFILVFVIFSAYMGIIPNYNYSTASRIRWCLGFRYPLYAPVMMFNITGLYLYLRRNRLQWFEFVIGIVLNYVIYRLTSARLSFYLSVLMIIAFMFIRVLPKLLEKIKLLDYLMIFSFIICAISSVYLCVIYNPKVKWMARLNSILGRRLMLAHKSLLQNGITLMGQPMKLVGNGLTATGQRPMGTYNYVDCSYVQVLQRYGIVFSIIWLGILTFTLYRFYKLKNYAMLIALTFVALHCTIDDLSLYLYYNTFWLAEAIIFVKLVTVRRIKVGKRQLTAFRTAKV